MMKRNDVLLLPVFEYRKGTAIKSSDDVLFVVNDRGVEQNFIDVFAKDEDTIVIQRLILVGVGFGSRSSIRCGRRSGGLWNLFAVGQPAIELATGYRPKSRT